MAANLSPIPASHSSLDLESSVDTQYSLRDRVGIGPLRIDPLSVNELTRRLIGHTFAPGKTNHVVTANAQFYVLAEEREDFRQCVGEAEYVCADGISVSLACKWLGRKAVARIAGVDLISHLCAESVSIGLPIYFLGGSPGTAARTAAILMKRYPGFRVAGVGSPPHRFLQRPDILSEV